MHCRNKKQWELNASWPVKRRGSCTKSLFLCSRQVPVSNPCTNNGFLCTELAPNSNPCTFSLFLWRTIYQLAQLCRNALPKLRFAGWLKSCYSGRRHQHACCAARGRRHTMSAVLLGDADISCLLCCSGTQTYHVCCEPPHDLTTSRPPILRMGHSRLRAAGGTVSANAYPVSAFSDQ